MPAEDLGLPAAHCRSEAPELHDVGCAAVGVEPFEPPATPPLGSCGVDLSEELLGEIGGADLAGRVAEVEAGLDASPASFG